MDAAALALKVDSSQVVAAANDLDRFAAASDRATKAGSRINVGQSGSIAKLVAEVQSANSKLTAIVGTLEKIAAGNRATAAANDNAARSFANVDSHVTAYRQHLEGLVTAQRAAGAATVAADAHIVAYAAHLAGLARAQQDANAHVLAYRANLAATAPALGQADAHVLAYRNSLNQVEEGARKASTAIKFTAQDSLNASRQLADIGVTAAMGMSPFMIAIQQGPQLLDILQNKAAMTGQTLGAVFRAAAVAVLSFMAPFLPLIALLTLAAAGIAALTRQANDDSGLKKYTTEMGYTKEEVKKLNAVTVTFGDTTKAVFQGALAAAAGAMGMNTKDMAKTWDSFLDHIVSGTRAALAGVYAGFAGTRAYLGELEKGGLLGIGKALIGQGDPNLLKNTYGKAYADGQKALDGIVAQARKNARARQDEMAKGFYDAPKTPKGPKPFTYDDLLKDADKIRNDLNKNAAQIGLYGEALARVTFEQDLLNKASERGLKLSPAQKTAIAGIAAELAKLAEANRVAKFMEDFNQQTNQQLAALEQQRGAIGMTAGALAAYTYEQEQLNRAIRDHITLTDADRKKIADDADRIGQATTRNVTEGVQESGRRLHNEQMRQLEAERNGLGLTGKALISYNYQQQEITRQLQNGVQFADLNIEAIRRQGDAYAAQRFAIDRQREAIEDAREVTRGFFADWINGVREGQNLFKSFADSAVNALNRIIDKLLDRTLEDFLDRMSGGGSAGGGLLERILGGKPLPTPGATPPISPNALGGVYGAPQRFANGGAFTNQIFSQPTLFRFANGGQIGEMGEAGPEAVMPLKRGPNGKLGVQAMGGGVQSAPTIIVNQEIGLNGTVGRDEVVQIGQACGQAALDSAKREFANWAAQWEVDGAVA